MAKKNAQKILENWSSFIVSFLGVHFNPFDDCKTGKDNNLYLLHNNKLVKLYQKCSLNVHNSRMTSGLEKSLPIKPKIWKMKNILHLIGLNGLLLKAAQNYGPKTTLK
tara:strand:+ start:1249 stop:1572 length:324 start_codon:yes stop_codon:yes gene_type:complete